MILRPQDFAARPHPVLSEPELSDEMKRHFRTLGLAETLSHTEGLDIEDECFHCGGKLATPYVYWQGHLKGLSLHPKCAAKVALGLTQDACELAMSARPASERAAIGWLDAYASKKEYAVEDGEFPA